MMRGGASIIITYTSQGISFTDSKFFSCYVMWKGIEIKPSCKLLFSGCEIQDAQYALKAGKKSFLSIANNEFDRNWAGVYMNGEGQTINLTSFSGNEFKHSSELNSPVSGQSPDPFDRSYVGLWLVDLPTVYFQSWFATSAFSNLNIGVLIQNAGLDNFYTENCPVFSNMVDEGFKYNTYQTGIGILADKGFLNISGPGPNEDARFTGCRNGIYAFNGVTLGAFSLKFSNNSIGILYEQNGTLALNQVNISDCAFDLIGTNHFGVLARNSNLMSCIIASCIFNLNATNAIGVEVSGILPFFSIEPILIEQNEFNIALASYGVRLRYTFLATIQYNGFNISTSSPVKGAAIYVDDANFVSPGNFMSFRVHGNCLNSTGAKWARGIAALATEKTWITKNTITGNIGNGVDLFEMCPTTRLETNYFKGNDIGLNIGATATIDPQMHRGNGWENESFSLFGARNLSPTWNFSIFDVDSDEDSKFLPTDREPEDWFSDEENPVTTPTYSEECHPNVPFSGDTVVQLTVLDAAISNGSHAVAVDNALMTWNAERYLFRKLAEHPEFLEQDTIYENFFDENSTLNVGAFYEVENAIRKLFLKVDTIKINQLKQYREEMDTLMSDLRDLYENSPSDTSSIYMAGDSLVFTDSLITALTGSIFGDIADEAEVILEKNEELEPDTIYQENEKKVNEIYLEFLISGGVLTDSQLIVLNHIASQCPSSGGLSVVRAIHLLPVCDQRQYDNLLDTCYGEFQQQQAFAPPATNSAVANKASIYPNPVKDILHVNIGKEEFLEGEVRITDVLGKMSFVYPFRYGDIGIEIPVGSLSEGFYLCTIYLDGRHHTTKKVIISK